jgi:hypothetical protein
MRGYCTKMNTTKRTLDLVRCALAALCFVLLSEGPVAAQDRTASAQNISVYALAETHVWQEYLDNGAQMLRESGALYGVGFTVEHRFPSGVTIRPAAELFGGQVDYDGHNQAGTPGTSSVGYFGMNILGDLGMRMGESAGGYVEPFVGIGLRSWQRDLKDGTTSDGHTMVGYVEKWNSLYGRLGLRGGVDFSNTKGIYVMAGLKLPLYNQNSVYFDRGSASPDFTMHPGNEESFFGEAGMRLDVVSVSLFIDQLRFSRSSNVNVTGGGYVYQPRSTSDLAGIKLGIVF